MKFCKECKWSKKEYRFPYVRHGEYFCHHPEHITKYDLVTGTPEVFECERHRCDERNWNGDLLSKCGEKGLLWEKIESLKGCSEETVEEETQSSIVEKIKNLFGRNNS